MYVCRWISSKEIKLDEIDKWRLESSEIVCSIEEIFPTSILDIQVHLLIHMVDEVELAGTVHTRWMFYLERFMKVLKGYVRQEAHPEGSMVEGWLVQESTFYITEFLTQINLLLPRFTKMEKEDECIMGDKA